MGFCDHCEGQRFDRAQVLRTLRALRRELREQRCGTRVDEAMAGAIKTLRDLEIPHLPGLEEIAEGEVIH